MTEIPFPQALKDLLGANNASLETLGFLNDGWNKLSLDERKSLFDKVANENDTLKRMWIVLNAISKAWSN